MALLGVGIPFCIGSLRFYFLQSKMILFRGQGNRAYMYLNSDDCTEIAALVKVWHMKRQVLEVSRG